MLSEFGLLEWVVILNRLGHCSLFDEIHDFTLKSVCGGESLIHSQKTERDAQISQSGLFERAWWLALSERNESVVRRVCSEADQPVPRLFGDAAALHFRTFSRASHFARSFAVVMVQVPCMACGVRPATNHKAAAARTSPLSFFLSFVVC
jgi:hypothetical protein